MNKNEYWYNGDGIAKNDGRQACLPLGAVDDLTLQ